jgi:hypothetical protein
MHPHFYSIYSNIDRYHLDEKYSIDVVSSFMKIVKEIDYDAEIGRLEKRKHNEFHYVEYLNYIPLDTITDIVINQFNSYIKTVPFSDITLFIKEYYNTFIYECEVLLQFVEKGKLTWWDSQGDFDFYTYSPTIYEYNMIVWQSKTGNDFHFYELYLKSLIQLLNHDIIEQYNNSQIKNNEPTKIETKPESKSLNFEGKPLNLYERYLIANKILDIDKKLHKLNIPKSKKNELLSYILGCNIDNAKKILDGKYDSKTRDFEDFFNELNLNE